jgi:NADH-quinone oxidoreductase subunit J
MDTLFEDVAFWGLAALTVGGSLLVVHVRDVFRAAIFLVLSFLGVAGLYVMLSAEFLAVVQILIYVGAISVLIIFAVMLTRDVSHGNRSTLVQPAALTMGVTVLGLLVWAIVRAEWTVLPEELPAPLAEALVDTSGRLGALLVRDFVLPFEIAGLVLLAAVIGALALVRQRDQQNEG